MTHVIRNRRESNESMLKTRKTHQLTNIPPRTQSKQIIVASSQDWALLSMVFTNKDDEDTHNTWQRYTLYPCYWLLKHWENQQLQIPNQLPQPLLSPTQTIYIQNVCAITNTPLRKLPAPKRTITKEPVYLNLYYQKRYITNNRP